MGGPFPGHHVVNSWAGPSFKLPTNSFLDFSRAYISAASTPLGVWTRRPIVPNKGIKTLRACLPGALWGAFSSSVFSLVCGAVLSLHLLFSPTFRDLLGRLEETQSDRAWGPWGMALKICGSLVPRSKAYEMGKLQIEKFRQLGFLAE